MNKAQQRRYESLYQQHLRVLHRQGKAATTIDVYARSVRRITAFFDCCHHRWQSRIEAQVLASGEWLVNL